MDEQTCGCSNVLTLYDNGEVILRPSCEYYSGKKCGKTIETLETPNKS